MYLYFADQATASNIFARKMAEEIMESRWDLSVSLMQCVLTDDIIGARCLLRDVDDYTRKEMVARGFSNEAPLFAAVNRGNPGMVKLLAAEGHADVEERGEYVAEDGSTHLVTPLWCAAVSGKLEVAHLLITELGANINSVSGAGETSVNYACALSMMNVVEFLVSHAIDINKPDNHGVTCLMKAVQSAELCQFLIDNGAELNSQDIDGNTALHHAIESDQFHSLRLITERGADPYIRNKRGDDPLQFASIRGSAYLVHMLIANIRPPISRRVESYHLVGAHFAELDQFDDALQFWTIALKLRIGFNHSNINTSAANPAYLSIKEVKTLDDLEALGQKAEAVYCYALMLRESILGQNHKDTITGLLDLGEAYISQGNDQRCMELWTYALRIQNSINMELGLYLHTLQSICQLLLDVNDPFLQFEDVFTILQLSISGFCERSEDSDEQLDLMIRFKQLIHHLVALIIRIDKTEEQIFRLKTLIYKLIQFDTKTDRPCLHVSIGQLLGSPIVELLLECGADIKSVDENRNTALHLCSPTTAGLR